MKKKGTLRGVFLPKKRIDFPLLFAPVIDPMCVYEYKYNNFGCEISRLVFADSRMINVDADKHAPTTREHTPRLLHCGARFR